MQNNQYDLFISHTSTDAAWVQGELLPLLQKAGARVLAEADFNAVEPHLAQFSRAVEQSTRILLVLTPAYIREQWSERASLIIQQTDAEAGTWRVFGIVLEPVEKWPARFSLINKLNFPTTKLAREMALHKLFEELQYPLPAPEEHPACPYPGLISYEEKDSKYFFGRETLISRLVGDLNRYPFVAIMGPSGSGKSSLVRAGLIPALRASTLFTPGEWAVCQIRPGEHPLTALIKAFEGKVGDEEQLVAALTKELETLTAMEVPTSVPTLDHLVNTYLTVTRATKFLLFVDQFEEGFSTDAMSPNRNAEFLALQIAMRYLIRRGFTSNFTTEETFQAYTCDTYVVMAARTDFYSDLIQSPIWLAIDVHAHDSVAEGETRQHRELVLPVNESGLRRMIVGPAEAVGVYIDTRLVDRLVQDALGEPGVLPLLQSTLQQLWEWVEWKFLPYYAYEEFIQQQVRGERDSHLRSALQVAIASAADKVMDLLTEPEHSAIARRIFLRLISFGEGRVDTRRQQSKNSLQSMADDDTTFTFVYNKLVQARLLTVSGSEDRQSVDIVHEALITGWPTLQLWIAELRDAEQTRRRLEWKAQEWQRLRSTQVRNKKYKWIMPDVGVLDVVGLEEARAWLADKNDRVLGISASVRQLITVSEKAAKRAAFRNIFQYVGGVLAILLVVVTVLAIVAVQQRTLAQVEQERSRALRLAADAQNLQVSLPEQALSLAVELSALKDPQTNLWYPEAEEALRTQFVSWKHWEATLSKPTDPVKHTGIVFGVTFGAWDSEVFSVDTIGKAIAWQLIIGERKLEKQASLITDTENCAMNAVVYNSEHKWLAIARSDGKIQVYAVGLGDARKVALWDAHEGMVRDLDFSADGRILASVGNDSVVKLWDTAKIAESVFEPIRTLPAGEKWLRAVDLSPDGRWLAVGSEDYELRMWDLQDKKEAPLWTERYFDTVQALSFSFDNRWFAAGGEDGTIHIWEIDNSFRSVWVLRIPEVAASVECLAFHPQRAWLAVGSESGVLGLLKLDEFEIDDPKPGIEILGRLDQPITAMAFSPSGERLATSSDEAIRLWRLTPLYMEPRLLTGHEARIRGVAFSPIYTQQGQNEPMYTLFSASEDRTLRVWSLDRSLTIDEIQHVTRCENAPILTVNVSQEGKYVAAGTRAGITCLWLTRDLLSENAAPTVLRSPNAAASPRSRFQSG